MCNLLETQNMSHGLLIVFSEKKGYTYVETVSAFQSYDIAFTKIKAIAVCYLILCNFVCTKPFVAHSLRLGSGSFFEIKKKSI